MPADTDGARVTRRSVPLVSLAIALLPVATGCASPDPAPATAPPSVASSAPSVTTQEVEIVATYPHDPAAFTQGLVFDNGRLLESTGLYGESSVREVDLAEGAVIQQVHLDETYFGEGLALLDERLYQVTWRENAGFVYARDNLVQRDTFEYEGEGWGLTTDGTALILSDGTDQLRWLDPATFEVERRVAVTDDGEPVELLNELEWIDGEIWANVWQTDRIVRIDPETGRVIGWLDLGSVVEAEPGEDAAELNGIAYDATSDRIFVTGKLWTTLFEIEVLSE